MSSLETKPTPAYTDYHPRWYRTRVSTWWWLGRWAYLKFILRELSSLSVAWFVIVTLLQVYALHEGPQDYKALQEWLASPLVVLVNLVAFFFVLFHSVTWFNLAPRAMVVRVGGKRLPDILIAAANYVAWVVVSVALGWLVLRG